MSKQEISQRPSDFRKKLQSYRLSSLEEPTDEMLQAIMEQVAESARQSSARAKAEIRRRFDLIRAQA